MKTEGNKKHSKGKILRIKKGYNPNSSSMGSVVFALPAALLGITAVFGVVSGIIMSAFIKSVDNGGRKKDETLAEQNDSGSGAKENNP